MVFFLYVPGVRVRIRVVGQRVRVRVRILELSILARPLAWIVGLDDCSRSTGVKRQTQTANPPSKYMYVTDVIPPCFVQRNDSKFQVAHVLTHSDHWCG